jgi:hypothetical protein
MTSFAKETLFMNCWESQDLNPEGRVFYGAKKQGGLRYGKR